METGDGRLRVLVPTAGSPGARKSFEYIVGIARKLKADMVVLHVYDTSPPAPETQEAFELFANAAADCGVRVQSRIQQGPIAETIASVAEAGDFELIIMGASEGDSVDDWISSNELFSSRLPVVVIPHALSTKGPR